ncbi:MAG: F0F1 ATP synthase subunit beta, partial [Bacteroidetes bacterium]|nr:F0F1 ATP synthase subunit beta [Bacteroidota bacterium]
MASTGQVVQVVGPVVDVAFSAGEVPDILDALEITRENQDALVLEVQQHLGENRVRAVAMDSTNGLIRGVPVNNTGQ